MADAHSPSNDAAHRGSTAEPPPLSPDEVPWGQRFFDRTFLLLFLGILIMAVFFTGWGLWEITSLPPAPLP